MFGITDEGEIEFTSIGILTVLIHSCGVEVQGNLIFALLDRMITTETLTRYPNEGFEWVEQIVGNQPELNFC